MNKLKYLGYSIVFQEVPDEVVALTDVRVATVSICGNMRAIIYPII